MWNYPITYFKNYTCFYSCMAGNLKIISSGEWDRVGEEELTFSFVFGFGIFCRHFSDLRKKLVTPLTPLKRGQECYSLSLPLAPKLAKSLLLENPSRCAHFAWGLLRSRRARLPKGNQSPSTSPSSPILWGPPSTPLF